MGECGALLATERYGSGESWQYVVKDGALERRRDGREAESRGNSFVGFFKVRKPYEKSVVLLHFL